MSGIATSFSSSYKSGCRSILIVNYRVYGIAIFFEFVSLLNFWPINDENVFYWINMFSVSRHNVWDEFPNSWSRLYRTVLQTDWFRIFHSLQRGIGAVFVKTNWFYDGVRWNKTRVKSSEIFREKISPQKNHYREHISTIIEIEHFSENWTFFSKVEAGW
jgi:hypothetical protein